MLSGPVQLPRIVHRYLRAMHVRHLLTDNVNNAHVNSMVTFDTMFRACIGLALLCAHH